MGTISLRRVLPFAVFPLMLLAVSPAEAQNDTKADLLERQAAQAEGSFAHRDALLRAARLYEEAAGLRAPYDPRAYSAYQNAGNRYYYAGNLKRAQRMFEAAAASARQRNALYECAMAHVAAVHVSVELNDRRGVDRNRTAALRLIESNQFTEEEQERIRSQLAYRARS